MSNNAGFQITSEPTDGQDTRAVAIALHDDIEDQHYYGATVVRITQRPKVYGRRHQMMFALLDIVDQLGKIPDEHFDAIMKPVERPF